MVLGLSKSFVIVFIIASLAVITGRLMTGLVIMGIFAVVTVCWRFLTR